MSETPEAIDERGLSHGDFVNVKLTGWLGQIIDFKQEGFNDPLFHLRVWTGSVLFKEWFTLCELELTPDEDDGGGLEAGAAGDNVIDFTAFKGKLKKDTPTGGAA